jgi:solute carrier family 25 phosphate transporter 3
VKEEGVAGLFRGWAPTFFGYCIQGACKYGFYEYFKWSSASLHSSPPSPYNFKSVPSPRLD